LPPAIVNISVLAALQSLPGPIHAILHSEKAILGGPSL
jgi:hypothetical protein